MSSPPFSFFFLLLLGAIATRPSFPSREQRDEAARVARQGIRREWSWAKDALVLESSDRRVGAALRDCVRMYEESEYRLRRLDRRHEAEDARTWLSGALTSHLSCLEGVGDQRNGGAVGGGAESLTAMLKEALALYAVEAGSRSNGSSWEPKNVEERGSLVASWDPSTAKPYIIVAKDGSGHFRSINDAVTKLRERTQRPSRVVIYVKSGIYAENVEIERGMENVMFVGDGIDKTIVTGNRNGVDGSTTFSSATFGVSGDGFWARDMTFENTAGPEKHQAVALRVGSDLSVFYRCSFRGYQDTLFLHTQRQFYRDCHIYGTIDFIFGNAAVVIQNCDIYVRRPMGHQVNVITAQGRDDPNQNTGISIHGCRVGPAPDFAQVKRSFKNYLGRPWKQYSRTVIMKTDLDEMIDPKGWLPWSGSFALATLYYGEYMNSGPGADTERRVDWPGFHVVKNEEDARPFTVSRFVQGESWIPATGAPFIPGL